MLTVIHAHADQQPRVRIRLGWATQVVVFEQPPDGDVPVLRINILDCCYLN